MEPTPKDLTVNEAYELAYQLSDPARVLVARALRVLPSHAELQRREQEKERRRQERERRQRE